MGPVIAVLGAGGHGLDVASVAEATGAVVLLRDDGAGRGLPGTDDLQGADNYLIGINSGLIRERIAKRTRCTAGEAVHPSATGPLPRYAGGVVIAANVNFGPGVRLGYHCHIGAGSFLTRCKLGDYVTVGPGVQIGGDCTIGDRVSIGIGAVLSNFVTVDDDVVIGAGAVIPPHRHLTCGTWVGVPAVELL